MNLSRPLVIAAWLFMLSAVPAHATLIDNGNTTIDNVTGLEWLDVTHMQGQSYNSVGGGFAGYVAAVYHHETFTELCSLFTALGDVVPNCLNPIRVVDVSPTSLNGSLPFIGQFLVRGASVAELGTLSLIGLGLAWLAFHWRKSKPI